MANFGKLQGSFASVTNENTAALINVNLDFSLYRCDTKPEYLSIGPALTVRRRDDAENGEIHRTACALGFLFQEMLPDAPALVKAYGRRVSEILARPDINPRGSASDGPFRSFVGADGTSIWAAATSSDASIAIHLLACVLARAFDRKTATSIWSEVVQERKKQVTRLVEDGKMVHPHTYVASKQAISRAELSNWDTSARAWLRRADESKAWEKHQFALIAENINLPYTSLGTTYSKVIATWIGSMKVLNNLLGNLPQQASDRAVLLAISSWHLHPNLLVFHRTATKVDFKDPLFPSSAVLSLGLECQDQKDGANIRWSLALSHLRHYGDPVAVRSNEDLARVSMPQFWLVALGSLFRTWGLQASEMLDAITWLSSLSDLISAEVNEGSAEISWIRSFCDTAKRYLSGDDKSQSIGLQLVKFGWRRALHLFGENHGIHLPYFGLRNPHMSRALEEEDAISRGITYLRGLVSQTGSDRRHILVSFTQPVQDELYYEWATAYTGRSQGEHQHRWIHFSNHKPLSERNRNTLLSRCDAIRKTGETCEIILNRLNTPHSKRELGSLVIWRHPPRSLLIDVEASDEIRFSRVQVFSSIDEIRRGYSIWAREATLSDYLLRKVSSEMSANDSLDKSLAFIRQPKFAAAIVSYLGSINPLSRAPRPKKRKRPINETGDDRSETDVGSIVGAESILMIQYNRPSMRWLKSVVALQIASILYEQLSGATVSLRLVDFQLCDAEWLPKTFRGMDETDFKVESHSLAKVSITTLFKEMTRAQSFGCIAMFESGRFNIKPEHLAEAVALCHEDSIFVAGIMLRDPGAEPELGPQVRRLVGSIGQPGLILLISPLDPRIRPTKYNPSLVEHKPYDGRREDKFQGVSLHLSFTEWKMPIDWESTGEIDQEVFLLESVLSVMHNGEWVSDINVLGLEKMPLDVFETECKGDCEDEGVEAATTANEIISLDDWEELLDPPPSAGIFRARSNWVARLAVCSILIQQNKGYSALLIGGANLCWKCLARHYAYPEPHLPQIIID
ncbi:hypothetical protein SAMD00023353_5700630 [Rosellinia necatrix]|uniref:Uncharacterized protein n=1 Tax=Rosellinia necatrix TaxID=77044 RepID=A0A1W2TTS0_ROSNE|nr:hypothetical protein SAMD00023353_5700630 [Rosellinia necatrix]